MSADECKTALRELDLETKGIRKDDLQVMLINYITKSIDPVRDPVQTADPLLGRVPVYLASLTLEKKAKWFLDEERRGEDREFELVKIREERQAAAETEEHKAAAAARESKLILLAFVKKEMLFWRACACRMLLRTPLLTLLSELLLMLMPLELRKEHMN